MNNGSGKEHIQVVSAAIMRDGLYLITQRSKTAVLPLKWEFPGGRVETGSNEEALAAKLDHRIGVRAKVGDEISCIVREYTDYVVELYLYECSIGDAQPQAKNVNAIAWVSSEEFEQYDFTPADEESMNALLSSDT